ncbi:MAG: hypothetical protein JW682_00680 [Campylobacterales bacterium]|nr:hypothetical protein [Campylobacterales bacterium]
MIYFFILSVTLHAQSPDIKLEKGEIKFRDSMEYCHRDFHFAWDVMYFEVLWYYVDMDKKHTYRLTEKVDFYTIFQSTSNHFHSLEQRQRRWLAGAVLKPSYFWQAEQPPYPLYSFRILIFKGKKGNLKAIESREEIRQMLGEIDTEAELLLWLHSSSTNFQRPFSYKKIGDLYRVRYTVLFSPTCEFHEYFTYYDTKGTLKKTEEIRRFHDKTCMPVTP